VEHVDFWFLAFIAILSLICEYVNATLGGGYGTLLVPILLLLGFDIKEVVPAALLSQLVAGIIAAPAHHRLGNVDLKLGSRDMRLALVLGSLGTLGASLAVASQLSLPSHLVKMYVGLMVLAVGISLLAGLRLKVSDASFSWRKMVGIGLLASFNKGISGGGYGPLLAGGQVLSGVGERKAIAITALSEAVTCLAGFLAYLLTMAWSSWWLAFSLVAGAAPSAPLSAYTVRKANPRWLRIGMGLAITSLGIAMLVRLFSYIHPV